MLPFHPYYYGLTPATYIDPGTGSLIIQVLIGVIVAGLVAAKVFWGRIITFFRGLFSRSSKQIKDDD